MELPLPAIRFLTREQAAAYVGVGVTVFVREVASGIWPAPMKRGARDGRLTWDRVLLDRAADALGLVGIPSAPDMVAAERAALEATSRGTPAQNRHQHRNTKAA